MNETFKDELQVAIRLIKIERKLGKETITEEEVDFVKELADEKKYPRAEYVMAVMYLNGNGVLKDKDTAMMYLDKSSEHASYDIQLKIAYVYHVLGKFNKVKSCLEKALNDCVF